jgi:hypothetical protein
MSMSISFVQFSIHEEAVLEVDAQFEAEMTKIEQMLPELLASISTNSPPKNPPMTKAEQQKARAILASLEPKTKSATVVLPSFVYNLVPPELRD